jgi:hypothetical protein
MRYLERCYKHLLYWLEIRDCITRLKALGMAETGMRARLQAFEGGAIRKELDLLEDLIETVQFSSAHSVKESYAGSLGITTTERRLIPHIVDPNVMLSYPAQ